MKHNFKKGIGFVNNHTSESGCKILLLLILIFLISGKIYSHDPITKGQFILTKENVIEAVNSQEWFDKMVEDVLLNDVGVQQNNPDKLFLNTNKISESSLSDHLILDSILGMRSKGYFKEFDHWYFDYDESSRLRSSKCLFFNEKNEFENITQIRTYNENGQIVKYLIRQPWENFMITGYGDSSAIDYRIEDYVYEQGNLVQKTITENSSASSVASIYTYIYTYNDKNQLIHASENTPYADSEIDYFYTVNDEVEYEIDKEYDKYFDENWITLIKYQYQFTDSIKINTQNITDLSETWERSQLDTVSSWVYKKYSFESFDSLERRTSVKTSYWDMFTGLTQNLSKAEFKYPENNTVHASYSDWVGSADSGSWNESARIDNTYDADGNLMLYTKTYYDERTDSWAIEEQKNYYYSYHQKSVEKNDVETLLPSLFPNPANNYITLRNLQGKDFNYRLFNMSGEQVGAGTIDNNRIAIGHLSPGVYFIKTTCQNHFFTGRFVKY